MNSKTNKNQMEQLSAHLIDIENLCCESIPTLENVIRAREAYFKKVRPGEDDLFFVTVSSKTNLEAAMFGWGHASTSCLEGDDGADI